jgi:hypothetical protein
MSEEIKQVTSRFRRHAEQAGRSSARTLTAYRYPIWITAKIGRIAANPFQGCQLIFESEVARDFRMKRAQESWFW